MMWKAILLAASLAPTGALADALKLEFPASARMAAEQVESYGSYLVPISGFENGEIQSIWAEGQVRQQAWQVLSRELTTLQLLAPLKSQIEADGFEVIFECEARQCGGFDFRYATAVLPEPDMHVDLGDFRFLAAHRLGAEKPEYVSLMVSRSAGRGFVQITRVGPEDTAPILVTSTKNIDQGLGLNLKTNLDRVANAEPASQGGGYTPGENSAGMKLLTQQLESRGRAVLEDLDFATGSSQLSGGRFNSLEVMASYLKSNPNRVITLVGHTDAEGSLAGNIALSKKRALSVKARLTDQLGVAEVQVKAEGVGYLAPITSNSTEKGREANRRVEVILSSIE